MARYGILIDGELQSDIFDSEKKAEDYAIYLVGCGRTGAETLYMSNPGDYPLDEYEDFEYEIVKLD